MMDEDLDKIRKALELLQKGNGFQLYIAGYDTLSYIAEIEDPDNDSTVEIAVNVKESVYME